MSFSRIICGLVVLFILAPVLSAKSMTIGYIRSDAIFKEFKGTKDAQEKYDKEVSRWEKEAAILEKKIKELQIASLLLVNRLFTQACRMQIYGMKDLILTQEQVEDFGRALDMKEIIDEEKAESGGEQQ